jgi:iron(III) transport system ATP-binding protein
VASVLATAGTTAVLVTHDQTEALTMAATVAVMRDGVIVQAAAPPVVYAEPVDVDAARFLGEAVLLPGETRDGAVSCALGVLPATGPARGRVTVMLRPEQIVRGASSTTVAAVRSISYHGHDALVTLTLGPQELLARWPSYGLPAVGQAVPVEVAGTAVVYPAGGQGSSR